MRTGVRRISRHVLGWGSLAVGVAGLVLPVVQGWFLIALGSLLLSPDVPLFARLLSRIERHLPFLRPHLDRARRRLAAGEDHPDRPPGER